MTTNNSNSDQFQNPHTLRPFYSVAYSGNMSLMGYEDETRAAEWTTLMTQVYPWAWPQFPSLHREFGYKRYIPVLEVRRVNFEIVRGGYLRNGRATYFKPGVQTVGWGSAAQVTIELTVAEYLLKWQSPEFGWREGMRQEITVSRRFIGRWARRQFMALETKADAELQSTLERAWWFTIGNTGRTPIGLPEPARGLRVVLQEAYESHAQNTDPRYQPADMVATMNAICDNLQRFI